MPIPINIPTYPPIEQVRAATVDERRKMLAEWDQQFVTMNPAYFHADGSQRTSLNRLFGKRR
jgi:hypothetical protein